MTLSLLIGNFVRRHWRAYASSGLMLAAISLLTAWVPRKIGTLVDALVARQIDPHGLLQELGWLLAIGIAIYFLRVGWRLQLFAAAYRFGVELRVRLYTCLTQQSPRFYQGQRTGDLMALATNDIDAIEMAAGEAMLAGFDGSLTLVVVLAMMLFGIDWRLTLIALLPFPLMGLAFWRISSQIHQASKDALERFADLNDHVQETLAGVRAVRALGLEERCTAEFSALAGRAADANLRAQTWEAAYEPAVGITLTTAGVLTLALGAVLVWQQQLTIGALTGFSLYLGQLIWPMFAAGWVLSLIERGRAAWDRLQPVLQAAPGISDEGTIGHLTPALLSVQNLKFNYPGQTACALNQVTLALAPGQTLGLVGPTGAGKSTLLRLLLRQFTPDSGDLRWGVHALADYRLDTLRNAISWVPQESFLFSASIAENIALARPHASRAEIEQVAHLASVHEDILRLPQGYDTPVGERGITLSGGQRQRVAIARALLSDCRLLLLDDALSAVDTATEARILRHLQELRIAQPERCIIIASHRLSAVVDADQIVVLRDARIIESGCHETLLEQAGWYAAQWRYQQLEASLDAL